MVLDIGKVGESLLELPAVDSLRGLAGVLERDTQVGTAGACALAGVSGGCGVTNHCCCDGGW